MKEQIKDKMKDRIEYILSKEPRDITDEEYNVLNDKLTELRIKEQQSSGTDSWFIIILMLFLLSPRNNQREDN